MIAEIVEPYIPDAVAENSSSDRPRTYAPEKADGNEDAASLTVNVSIVGLQLLGTVKVNVFVDVPMTVDVLDDAYVVKVAVHVPDAADVI